MQRKDFISLNQIFSEGHKVLVRGILLFGAFSLMLAGLVFIFPTFIGVLVAIFLLLTGLITLIAGFHFWQLEKEKIAMKNPLILSLNQTPSVIAILIIISKLFAS